MFWKKKEKQKPEEIELPPPPKPPEELVAPAGVEESGKGSELEFPDIQPKFPEIPSEEEGYVEDVHEMPGGMPEHPTLESPEFEMPEDKPRPVFEPYGIKAEKPEEIERPQEVKPMFVAVDDFKALSTDTSFVRSKLVEAEEYLERLTDLKNQELKAFDKWRKTLESVESKLAYIDKVIAEAQG